MSADSRRKGTTWQWQLGVVAVFLGWAILIVFVLIRYSIHRDLCAHVLSHLIHISQSADIFNTPYCDVWAHILLRFHSA